MVIQEYDVYLSNGEKVTISEPYDMTGPDTLLTRYAKSTPDTPFSAGNSIDGFCYFKVKDIVCIKTGDVKELDDRIWNMLETLK